MEQKLSPWFTPGFEVIFKSKYITNCSACGKLNSKSRCKGCGAAYCSKECQKRAWPVHKRICGSIDKLIEFCNNYKFIEFSYCFMQMSECREFENLSKLEDLREFSSTINDVKLNNLRPQTVTSEDTGKLEKVFLIGSKSYFPYLTYANSIENHGIETCVSMHSSCKIVYSIPLLFLLNPETLEISGEVVGPYIFLRRFFHADEIAQKLNNSCVSLNIIQEPIENNIYKVTAQGGSLAETIKINLDRGERASIYLIEISVKNRPKDVMTDLPIEQSDKFWEIMTSTKLPSQHSLAIVILNKEAFIIQAYFGHYTFKEWLNFDNDLKYHSSPDDIKAWRHSLNPKPKFRGKLTKDKLLDLTNSLISLTKENNHIQTFSDITGIINTKETIEKSYFIGYLRIDLDRQIIV